MSSQPTGRQRMSRSKLSCCLIAVTFVLLGASSLYGDTIAVDESFWWGSRDSGENGGIDATGDWVAGKFELSWHIEQDDSNFTYEYWITGALGGDLGPPELSLWILQLTMGVDWGDTFGAYDFEIPELDGANPLWTEQQGNPDLPGEFFGVKFEFDDQGTVHIEFTTEQAPVWGVFYAKGGDDTYAYNTGFADGSVMPNAGDFDEIDWIARPNGATSVPEPSTLVLLLSGMGVLAGAARFRKKT